MNPELAVPLVKVQFTVTDCVLVEYSHSAALDNRLSSVGRLVPQMTNRLAVPSFRKPVARGDACVSIEGRLS